MHQELRVRPWPDALPRSPQTLPLGPGKGGGSRRRKGGGIMRGAVFSVSGGGEGVGDAGRPAERPV